MEKRKKVIPGIVWIVLPFFIVGSMFLFLLVMNSTTSVFNEYPQLSKGEDLNVVVRECEKFKGTTLITTDGMNKISVKANNWGLKHNMLYFYLEPGDSLEYKAGSKYINLHKKAKEDVIRFEIIFIE